MQHLFRSGKRFGEDPDDVRSCMVPVLEGVVRKCCDLGQPEEFMGLRNREIKAWDRIAQIADED